MVSTPSVTRSMPRICAVGGMAGSVKLRFVTILRPSTRAAMLAEVPPATIFLQEPRMKSRMISSSFSLSTGGPEKKCTFLRGTACATRKVESSPGFCM